VFTARYGLISYIKQITFSLVKVNLSAGWRYVVMPRQGRFGPREGAPAPIAEEAGWAPEQLWKSVVKIKSLYPTGG
jgi:hypothetical protein